MCLYDYTTYNLLYPVREYALASRLYNLYYIGEWKFEF
jgi:hypothetical protein